MKVVCLYIYKKKTLFGRKKEDRIYRFDSLVEAEAWKTFLIMVERIHPKQIFIKEAIA